MSHHALLGHTSPPSPPPRDYALPGDYRPLIIKPENVQWYATHPQTVIIPHPQTIHPFPLLCFLMRPGIVSGTMMSCNPSSCQILTSLKTSHHPCHSQVIVAPPRPPCIPHPSLLPRWAAQGPECGLLPPSLLLCHHGHQGAPQDGHLITLPGSAGLSRAPGQVMHFIGLSGLPYYSSVF